MRLRISSLVTCPQRRKTHDLQSQNQVTRKSGVAAKLDDLTWEDDPHKLIPAAVKIQDARRLQASAGYVCGCLWRTKIGIEAESPMAVESRHARALGVR